MATTSVDPSHLVDYLSPPSTSQIQSRILSSSPLAHLDLEETQDPSAVLDELIQKQRQRVQAAQERRRAARSALQNDLQSSLDRVVAVRGQLDELPTSIERAEDELLRLSEALGDDADNQQPSSSSSFSSLMQTLNSHSRSLASLHQARDYFALLARAEDLRLAAQAPSATPQDSLLSFSKLCTLISTVESATQVSRNGADDTTPSAPPIKAVAFLRAQRDAAFGTLRERRVEELSKALEKAGWPSPPHVEAGNSAPFKPVRLRDDKGVQATWANVCALQDAAQKLGIIARASSLPPLRAGKNSRSSTDTAPLALAGSDAYVGLLSVSTLLAPLLLRFRFHFDSTRTTNRLDKPEWYMAHILDLFKSYARLFRPVKGDVAALCAGTPMRAVDTGAELLHGLLLPLRRKLRSSVPMLLEHPSLLAHTISHALLFDEDLREAYAPARDVGSEAAGGAADTPLRPGAIRLAAEILDNPEWFEAWLEAERKFALDRADEVLGSANAWAVSQGGLADEEDELATWSALRSTVGDQGAEKEEALTTRSARIIVELLESLTERYRPLPTLSQRAAFLSRIQLPLLRVYVVRLQQSLDAFESMSSVFARAIPGGMDSSAGSGLVHAGGGDADRVRGLKGLGRLLKALLSAQYVADALARASASSFAIELANDLTNTAEGKELAKDIRSQELDEDGRAVEGESLSNLLRKGLQRSRALRPLGGGSGAAQRGTSTDRAAGAPVGVTKEEEEVPGLWDENVGRFREVVTRARTGIQKLIVSETLEAMREYAHRSWEDASDRPTSPSPSPSPASESASPTPSHSSTDRHHPDDIPTPSLIPSLTILSSHLSHILPTLPAESARQVYRDIAAALARAVVDRVVLAGGSHRFDAQGAARFAADVDQGWLGVARDLPGSASSTDRTHVRVLGRRPEAAWRLLRSVATLLALPSSASFSTIATNSSGATTSEWTLSRATRALFDEAEEGNQRGWRALQEQLGLDESIDVKEARDVVRRRVECWK